MAQIIVLGAGIAGVCTALALQERGHDCLIIDRARPGTETSYGNAGIIQSEAVEPYGLPFNPLALLRMALGWKNAVDLNWTSLPRQFPALYAYWRFSAPARMADTIPVWMGLVSEAVAAHASLIEASGSDNLIRKDGYWEAHESERALSAATVEAERKKQRYGIEFAVADRMALSREEPALNPRLAGAIHWKGPWTCLSPGDLVGSYANLFSRLGGNMMIGNASSLKAVGNGWEVAGEQAERVVIALGPWSPELLRPLGYHVPMVRKRGYHRHYVGEAGLLRPILLADHSVVLSPMLKGLRIATAAQLSDAPPQANPRQLAKGEAAARTLLDLGNPLEQAPWSGTRPCLPGMLPLVCAATRHPGLWLNFGHGHQGFTLGPVTANRLARAMDGDSSAIQGLDAGIW